MLKRFAALSFTETGDVLQACTFFASDDASTLTLARLGKLHAPDGAVHVAVIDGFPIRVGIDVAVPSDAVITVGVSP